MLTVFTPSYNRSKELIRLYESLKRQTVQDFEWLVIDDGSVDDTSELIQDFINEGIINIRFHRHDNCGKMKTHNRGAEMAHGELFVCIDADDWLTENAVEQIIYDSKKISDQNIAGMMYLDYDGETDTIVGTGFPWKEKICNSYDVYNKHGVKGDKTFVFKTSVIREFPFPEIENEKFVPEALVYNRIAYKYSLLCVNIPIKRVEYLPDGYTNNYFNVCKKNPKAQVIYYKELYLRQPTIYNAAAYNMYCIYAGISVFDAIKDHPNKFICILTYLPAYIKYLLKEHK